MKNKINFIVGPTAIGKSTLGIKLAKKIKGEIINADSMQVYSNLKILTARPTKEDHLKVPHHLYGFVNGMERYNVAKWSQKIFNLITNNDKKNIPSIVVGGTGMYIDILLNGIVDLPDIPESLKKKSEKLIIESGLNNFIEIIKKFDLQSLKKISNKDYSRLRRIWEVYNFTGTPLSVWVKNKNKFFLDKSHCNIYLFTPIREKIYQSVNDRFKKMITNGAIEEVQDLNFLKLDKSLPIMRAHGVPEISNYLSKKLTLNDMIIKGQQVTRNYVKRQLTWWRSSTLPIERKFDKFPNEIDVNLINFD